MAFNKTTLSPTRVGVVGVYTELAVGTAVLSGGTVTVTIPGATSVEWARADSRTANRAYVSATSTNTLTITGTSTDTVDWIAKVVGGL